MILTAPDRNTHCWVSTLTYIWWILSNSELKLVKLKTAFSFFFLFIFCRRGSAWLTGNKLQFALGGRLMVSNCLWERDREEGGTVPSQQSRRYQRADCDGGWEHSTRHFSHVEPSVLTLRWHTIIHVFFSLSLKGSKTRTRPLPLRFSVRLLNWVTATSSSALFSSSMFDSQALVPGNYINRLIFTNQMWHSERLLAFCSLQLK